MNIETERIVIRKFQKKDAAGLLEYLSNPRVNCFAGDRLCSEEAAWAYMQDSQKDIQRPQIRDFPHEVLQTEEKCAFD